MEHLKAGDLFTSSGSPKFSRTASIPSLELGPLCDLSHISQRLQADAEEIAETISNWKKDSIILNQLCEVLSDAVIRVDSRGFVFEFNEAACKMFVTSQAYMLGKTIGELLYTDWDTFKNQYDPPSFEHMVHRLDGTSLIVSTSLTHVTDGEYILVMRDITQRVKSEQDIRMLSAALNQATDAILISNSANRIIFVNKAFVAHTGYTEDEVIGRDPGFLKSGVTTRETYKGMWQALKSKHPWEGYLINKRKDGVLIKDFMMVTPVMNGDPDIPAFYISVKRREWSTPYEESSSGESAA